jgi:hypothetical protein
VIAEALFEVFEFAFETGVGAKFVDFVLRECEAAEEDQQAE